MKLATDLIGRFATIIMEDAFVGVFPSLRFYQTFGKPLGALG